MNRDNGAMSSPALKERPSFTRRALRELLYCLVGLPLGLGLFWILAGLLGSLGLMAVLARVASGPESDGSAPPVAPGAALVSAGSLVGLLVLVMLLPRL